MASESSFDVVSKVDRQEVDNAVNQAAKEIGTRYDFRNVGAEVVLKGDALTLRANTAERCLAVLDVLQTKLVKRGVSLRSVDFGDDAEPKPSGKEYRLEGVLKEGLSQEVAKKISKQIRDEFGKSVKAVIQGDEVRVSSKSRDDLQAVQRALKANDDIDAALTFTNYR
ncbi:YajQ family cyclic di-GMP-binding protein [Kytococcus schroeteri]|uniref:YajQ family cyclic di-GMP-binding protein n=1 Tax=Kytococcus schroeteri TaxID=138300 RepID=UPI001143AA3F|nr:YajQ family cyclic di-GMP-binding protein [Kytococcus schroeteri]